MTLSPPKDLSRFAERTRLVHAGRDPAQQHGFVNTPIYRGSTVLYPSADDFMHRRGAHTHRTQGGATTGAPRGGRAGPPRAPRAGASPPRPSPGPAPAVVLPKGRRHPLG